MYSKRFSISSPALLGSFSPVSKKRQPVITPVLIPTLVLFLMAITLLSLLMKQTEVTLTVIGAILSLSTKATGENMSNR